MSTATRVIAKANYFDLLSLPRELPGTGLNSGVETFDGLGDGLPKPGPFETGIWSLAAMFYNLRINNVGLTPGPRRGYIRSHRGRRSNVNLNLVYSILLVGVLLGDVKFNQ